MNPASSSAQPEDIGPVVAIVGTRGWQCRLCSTTFPRAFSIDHHMIASHHPQAQQASSALAATSPAAPSVGHQLNQDTSTVGGSVRAGVDRTDCRAGLSSSEAMEGVRSTPVGSEPCGDSASPSRGERRVEGSFPVKVEPGENSSDITGNTVHQSAAVYFENKSEQQGVRPSVEATVSSGHVGNSNNPNTRDEMIPSSQNVQDMNSAGGCQPCSFAHGDHTAGSCSHTTKPATHCKASDSLKPCKRRTCCGQWFDSKREFRQHGRDVHFRYNHRTFDCHICCAEFQHKRGLNRHLKEKGEVPFACGKCPKRFHNQTSLIEHQKVCCSSEAQKSLSSAGDRMVEGTNQAQNPSLSEMTSHQRIPDSFPWECSKCKKHFGDKNSFRRHLKECGIFVWKEGKRHFTCNLCGTGFPNLVRYHQHYVHDHKLAWLGEHVNSPARFSPFLGNSPVPSPVPSVTSEINMAMAGVSLNQSRAMDARECPSPGSSTIDLTAGAGLEEENEQSSFQDAGCLVSTPQVTTTGYSDSYMAASAVSSIPLLVPATRTFNSLSLTPATDSSGPVSLTTTTSTSEPQSLASTSGSSDPRSLMSDFSSFCPISLGSTASSEQTSEVDSIIISDGEDSHSSDSSSDSDEDWEILMDQNEGEPEGPREKEMGPGSADCKTAYKEGGFPCGDFHHQHPPPPPPPHPDHPFPPPPFFAEHFGPPFGPPFPPFFHPRFAFRGGFRGGFMRGFRPPFFGAARFGPPGWFGQEDSPSDHPEKSEHAAGASSSSGEAPGTSSGPTSTAGPNQESSSSQHGDAAQDQDQSSAFSHAAEFCKWAGKWKKGGPYFRLMGMKMMWMLKSRHMDSQFLVCPEYECLQTFTEESELDKHCLESHSASKEYICFICQQPHSQPGAFNRHIREHSDMWCHIRGRGRGRGCGRGMGWGRKFFKHFWKAGSPYGSPYEMFCAPPSQGHSHQESDKDSPSPDLSSSKDFKECPVCKKKYRANSRENFFERHVNSHYGVEVYTFKCEECGKKFLERGKFKAHVAKHKSPQHVCQECGKSYQSKTSLTRHQRTHTGERPHKCPDCEEGFIELRELERHRMKHTGQDPFQCKVCGRGFTLKDSLLNHVRKKHPEESPVLCCRRAMPLTEADLQLRRQQREKAEKASLPSPSQAPAGAVIEVKVEEPDPQEPSIMEWG